MGFAASIVARRLQLAYQVTKHSIISSTTTTTTTTTTTIKFYDPSALDTDLL